MKETESQRTLLPEMAELHEEASRLRTENTQMRTDLGAAMPLNSLASLVHQPSRPRGPSADMSGRSWDSIALDLGADVLNGKIDENSDSTLTPVTLMHLPLLAKSSFSRQPVRSAQQS